MENTVIYDLPEADYHGDLVTPEPSLSASMAKIAATKTMRHVWMANSRLNPDAVRKDTKAFDMGKAVHGLVLGKGADYRIYPNDVLAKNGAASTKEAKLFEEECRAEGCVPLKEEEYVRASYQAAAIGNALMQRGVYLDPADSEVSAFAQIDDIWCRMRADNAPRNSRFIWDVKMTSGGMSDDALMRTIVKFGYDIQAAHYEAVWQAATGEKRKMRFAFVESEPPHEVRLIELYDDKLDVPSHQYIQNEMLSADWYADARHKLMRIRRQWRECLDTGNWPGYPKLVAQLGAPTWHRKASQIDAMESGEQE